MLPEFAAVDVDDLDGTRVALADRLGGQLIRFIKALSKVSAHIAAEQKDSVETASYALLGLLVQEGPRRTTALAELVHSDVSTVSRQSAALVRLGLIERRPDPQDGRACLLAATAEGERVYEHNRKQRDAHLARMLEQWSEGELQQLVDMLERFNVDFEKYRAVLLGGVRTAEDAQVVPVGSEGGKD